MMLVLVVSFGCTPMAEVCAQHSTLRIPIIGKYQECLASANYVEIVGANFRITGKWCEEA